MAGSAVIQEPPLIRLALAFERDLMAAVFVTMLDRCIDDWRKNRARTPLATIVRRAAKVVAKLG